MLSRNFRAYAIMFSPVQYLIPSGRSQLFPFLISVTLSERPRSECAQLPGTPLGFLFTPPCIKHRRIL